MSRRARDTTEVQLGEKKKCWKIPWLINCNQTGENELAIATGEIESWRERKADAAGLMKKEGGKKTT